MIIKLMLDSEKPLYQQLKEKIIHALAKGELVEGELLPSVRILASSLTINMHTVNKAYNQLADEGFLTMHKGKGAMVNSPDKYIVDRKTLDSIKESLSVISAQAKCRSVGKRDFLKMCEETYNEFEGEQI